MDRRKTDDNRKEQRIPVRVTDEQKEKIVAAAERAGLEASAMLRLLGLREYESPTLMQVQSVSPVKAIRKRGGKK